MQYKARRYRRILGDDKFIDAAMIKSNEQHLVEWELSEVIEAVCNFYGVTQEQMKLPGKIRPYTHARALAAALVNESRNLSLTDLALLLNKEVSALSKAAQRLLMDEKQTEQLRKVRNILEQMSKCRT